MKNRTMILLAFICTFANLKAQTEIKINPIGALFSSPDVSAEFALAENIGIEPSVGMSFYKIEVGKVSTNLQG
jgi:hypothetical protein